MNVTEDMLELHQTMLVGIDDEQNRKEVLDDADDGKQHPKGL